jgi:hypothetical protein
MTALGRGGGICLEPPPTPDCVVHISALFGLRGTDVERPHIDEHGRYILYMGDGHAQFFDCT